MVSEPLSCGLYFFFYSICLIFLFPEKKVKKKGLTHVEQFFSPYTGLLSSVEAIQSRRISHATTVCRRSLSSHQCVHHLQPAIIPATVGWLATSEAAMATSIVLFRPDPGPVGCHGSKFIWLAMVRCCHQMPSITTGSTQPPPVFIDPLPSARSVHFPPPLSISILVVYDSEPPRTCRSAASVGGALLHALLPAIIPATPGPNHRLLCRPISPFVHLHTLVISRFRQLPST
jgi:hypothetical protein